MGRCSACETLGRCRVRCVAGFIDIDQLHHMAVRKIDYYIVDGMNFGCMKERIDMGFIKTDKTPGTGPPTLSAHRVGRAQGPTTYGPSAIPRPLGADARLVTPPDSSRTTVAPPVALAARSRLLRVGEPPSAPANGQSCAASESHCPASARGFPAREALLRTHQELPRRSRRPATRGRAPVHQSRHHARY